MKQLEKMEPFIRIIKKNKLQKQGIEQRKLFIEIKEEFIRELILKIYQVKLLIRVKIDALDFIVGVYLLQKHKDRVQYLVIYYSQKITLLELNYNIYNKELLAIVVILKEQRAFLQGIVELFVVKIDHKNLTGFLIIKELNQRQVRQAEILFKYYFEIKYISGIDNARVDILSRKAELQGNKKLLGAMLRLDKDRKVRYNYLQLAGTYKILRSLQDQRIQEVKEVDLDYKEY